MRQCAGKKEKMFLNVCQKKKIFYKCDKCKYKFSRNEGAEVIACPYCGSKESFYAVK